MAVERELLSELQAALRAADIDSDGLVEQAWTEARDEVHATLKRLITHDLLTRSLASLRGEDRAVPAQPPEQTAPTSLQAPDSSTRQADGEEVPGSGGAPPAASMTYLFGIVAAGASLPQEELPALPTGGELRFLDGPTCRALVCDVDPELFEVLRDPGPQGLDLLAAAARAHDAILQRFAEAPVLPLGLGTALPHDAAVQRMLHRHGAQLEDELQRFEGRTEWAVTVHPAVEQDDDPPVETAASGRDYLQRQRDALHARDDRWGAQEQLAEQLHGALAACAGDARRVQSRPLEESAPPLLHGVYLVATEDRGRFDSTVTYLRSEHPDAVIEVTGPWPPYHFVSLDVSVDAEPVS